jgi:hypothetical protein
VGVARGGYSFVHWNGRSWSRIATSWDVYALSAVTPRDIWAVGTTHSQRPPILHWNGRSWRRVRSPSPRPATYELTCVAAVSARDAWAAGVWGFGSRTLTLRWNGRSWNQK